MQISSGREIPGVCVCFLSTTEPLSALSELRIRFPKCLIGIAATATNSCDSFVCVIVCVCGVFVVARVSPHHTFHGVCIDVFTQTSTFRDWIGLVTQNVCQHILHVADAKPANTKRKHCRPTIVG